MESVFMLPPISSTPVLQRPSSPLDTPTTRPLTHLLGAIKTKDRPALVKVYEALGGPGWDRADGWCSSKPLDEWFGVTLDDKGRVETIYLGFNGTLK